MAQRGWCLLMALILSAQMIAPAWAGPSGGTSLEFGSELGRSLEGMAPETMAHESGRLVEPLPDLPSLDHRNLLAYERVEVEVTHKPYREPADLTVKQKRIFLAFMVVGAVIGAVTGGGLGAVLGFVLGAFVWMLLNGAELLPR